MKLKIFIIFFCLLPLFPISADMVGDINYPLEAHIGGYEVAKNLIDYISHIYEFALGIVGILATVVIIYGGVRWASAAGNESSITAAKEAITGALIGLIIAVGAYSILNFINPQLIAMNALSVQKVEIPAPEGLALNDLPLCSSTGYASVCGQTKCNSACANAGKPCSGTVCDDASLDCVRSSVDPKNSMQCKDHAECGTIAEVTMNYADSTTDPAGYQQKLCEYYASLVSTAQFGGIYSFTADELNGNAKAKDYYYHLCNEDWTQREWAEYLQANDQTLYKHIMQQNIPLNCDFGCMIKEITVSGSGAVQTCGTNK